MTISDAAVTDVEGDTNNKWVDKQKLSEAEYQ